MKNKLILVDYTSNFFWTTLNSLWAGLV